MKNYRLINNICGWIAFAIATIAFFLTVEPTASWWDCGEYISTSFKLQVGHPPGAPLFQMIGRFFSLMAFGDVTKVALMVNIMSALSSSFTILFLFWSITKIAKKLTPANEEMTIGRTIAIMGSGFVGSLAFAFSDSFWFSAGEGEVYAMSSFFTALVFWFILKWEDAADKPHNERWIVLIAFVIGLSIGVHLLNLLAIPAIAFVIYFKRYKVSRKGIIITGFLSLLVLAVVMYFIIPWIVKLAGLFELFFVNSVGMPFNSGTIFYFALIIAGIILGLRYTKRKQKAIGHFMILAFTFILIGYSSFFMLVIRANAKTPIDENAPVDAISLLSYLNREQYGTWPLWHGQYYNAPVVSYKDGSPIYQKDHKIGKYVITDDRKQSEPVYDTRFTTVFPRMWSNQKSSHISAYKEWGGEGGTPVSVTKNDGTTETQYIPTFGQNLRFFFKYQVDHMYLRYFMWNFAGRQNDIEGHGGIENGNWISGIPFIDNARLGNQSDLPSSMDNPAKNKFFMLPLLLGLIGLLFHINRNYKDSIIVGLLFLMTGLAIIIYLNQVPYQPRERDYSYAGSFLAFTIWIGLGVMAIWERIPKKINQPFTAGIVSLVCLLFVPGLMAKEGWDDHDRSGKYACRDFAANYLNSCAPNAILITNGDNDTFPLWYAQEVEGIRTDVRVVNYMLASGDWYIHQLQRKIYDSEALPFTLSPEKYTKGINEYIPFYDMKVEGYTNISEIIQFIDSEDERTKLPLQSGRKISFLPTKDFRMVVDSAACIKNGIVPPELAGKMVPVIEWKMKKSYLIKNDLMLLDFLATSNWTRPLYFANPGSVDDVFDIGQYLHLEGFVYKFMPVLAGNYINGMGGVTESKKNYDLLMNKCKWGNLNNPDVTIDRESSRNSIIPKNNFLRLAQILVDEGKNDSAVAVLDRCQEIFPNEKIHYDMYSLPFCEVYYKAGATSKCTAIMKILINTYTENIKYYSSMKPKLASYYTKDKEQAVMVLRRLEQMAVEYKQAALGNEIKAFFAANPALGQ